MPVNIVEKNEGKILEVSLSGKLHADDYAHFTPVVERLIQQYGKIRMLMEMRDFHGWDAGALWEDIKFDVKHFGDIERLAMVGESKWEKGMSKFCAPFTRAKIRYFPVTEIETARQWLTEA